MSFSNLIKKYNEQYIVEVGEMPDQSGAQQGQQPVAPGDPTQGGPAAQVPEVPAPTRPLTTEGKRFMIELALKALAYNPDHIAEPEKDIFSNEVTIENAEEILEHIQRIVGEQVNRAEV